MAIKDVDCICSLSFILSPSNFKVIVPPSKSPHHTSSMHAELSTNTSARKLPSSQPSSSIPQGLVRLRSCRYPLSHADRLLQNEETWRNRFPVPYRQTGRSNIKSPSQFSPRSVRHSQEVQNSPHIPGYATLMKRLAVFRTSSYFDVAAAREIGIQFHGNAGIIHRK